MGFEEGLGVLLLEMGAVVLHGFLVLLFCEEKVFKGALLGGLVADEEGLEGALFKGLLLKGFLDEKILLFLLVEAVEVEHVVDAADAVFAVCSLGVLADFS